MAPPEEPPAVTAPAPEEDERLSLTILPNFGYTADDGFGLGFYAELTAPPPPGKAVRTLVVAHTYLSTEGFHNQRLRFDLPGLGAQDKLRLGGMFAFRAWLNDGYWGIGNGTVRDADYVGTFDADDPDRHHYRYQLVQPFGHLALARDLSPRASAYGSLNVRFSWVKTYEGSLLEAERPYGVDGGLATQLGVGLLWDSRDDSVDPRRGALLEASSRFVYQPLDNSVFGGPFASVRGWIPLGPGVVVAGRVMGEHLFGDVPFYEMVHWGGFTPTSGFGGAATLRGYRYGRWRGPGKAVANGEIRCAVGDQHIGDSVLHWHLAPLADVGVVWGAGGDGPEQPDVPFHPSGGLGVRGVWNRDIAARIDGAVGFDAVDDGIELVLAPTWGVYLDFAYMY